MRWGGAGHSQTPAETREACPMRADGPAGFPRHGRPGHQIPYGQDVCEVEFRTRKSGRHTPLRTGPMIPAHRPAEFLTVVIVAVTVLLCCTITGRYILRRLAIGAAIIAACAVIVFDYGPTIGR